MKKKLFGLLMLFGLIGSLASCSSDDDNNGEGETDDVSIVGKWDVNQKQALNCTWEPEIEIKLDLMSLMTGLNRAGLPNITTSFIAELVTSMGAPKVAEALKTIEFEKDGNIKAFYVDADDKTGKAVWSPSGLATYKTNKDKALLTVKLNAGKIIEEAKIEDVSLQKVLKNILLNPFSVKYDLNTQGRILKCYINKDELKRIVGAINENLDDILTLVPEAGILLPTTVPMVGGKSISADTIKKIVKDIMQDQMPSIIEKTTTFELALNMTKAN